MREIKFRAWDKTKEEMVGCDRGDGEGSKK